MYIEYNKKNTSVQEIAKKKITNIVNKKNSEEKDKNNNDNAPLAYIELNLGNGKKEVILIKEGESARTISEKISAKYGKYIIAKNIILFKGLSVPAKKKLIGIIQAKIKEAFNLKY